MKKLNSILFISAIFSLRKNSIAGILASVLGAWFLSCSPLMSKVIEFADNGGLKMLYDNRMYPQAVMHWNIRAPLVQLAA